MKWETNNYYVPVFGHMHVLWHCGKKQSLIISYSMLLTLTFTVQFKNVPEVLSLLCTCQLKQSKLEKTELDASFKNQSIKFKEIVKEMKLSRYLDKCLHCLISHYSYSYTVIFKAWSDLLSLNRKLNEHIFFRGLLQDKQEELDATQCQAHWIVLQQESIIAETSKELIVISDLVNDWLSKFGNQNEPEEVGLLLFSLPHTPLDFPTVGVFRGQTEFFHSLE